MVQRLIPSSLLILAGLAAPLYAQRDTIRANIRGGGGDGKCTFEVEVDGVAEVEIRGDTGRLRTISGSPASWRRLDCNQAMPLRPYDFRFKGVDGRGRQDLIRDPESNRGIAVIRVEDPKGGREGYTGDLIWRGGSGTSSGRYPYDERGNRDRDYRDRDYRDRDYRDYDRGNRGRRISDREAMDICVDEAARRLNVDPRDVDVRRGSDSDRNSINVTYNVRRRNRFGSCTISNIGRVEDFR